MSEKLMQEMRDKKFREKIKRRERELISIERENRKVLEKRLKWLEDAKLRLDA